ncbi:hypothetical protein CH371_18620 [Leptospira wolffii]|uniref:Uncharacterized protein n=1 Tax=Leptospira wolffii TaxID=409998 RepID=A0A2M9Z7Q2_9LEPT|nr:tetratricopeptide repeat protein [Leptospira wolffii]PJZ64428.1 hypothetical protein CH371_18620 [Leptospira wolffii]
MIRKKSPSSFKLGKYIAFFLVQIFAISILSSPTESDEMSWLQEGELLLEMKRFSEAEHLANSVLESTPSDLKAEFLLTRAWIGLGSQERKNGNITLARKYFEKAYEKWPLNETLKSELAELKNQKAGKKAQQPNTSNKGDELSELTQSINSLKEELSRLRAELEEAKNSYPNKWVFTTIQILLGLQILIQGLQLLRSNILNRKIH